MVKLTHSMEQSINDVWDAIGHDIVEMCGRDNEIAIETCMDAGRIEAYGDPKSAQDLRQLVIEYGYTTVLTSFSAQLKLV